MISYIITFFVGIYFGVAFMCLFQINKKFSGNSSNTSSTLMEGKTEMLSIIDARKILAKRVNCKLRSNGMPVPLLRNCYSIFYGTKYR